MSKNTEIYRFMNKKLNRLLAVRELPKGKAELAALRKGVGKEPGESFEASGVILPDIPEGFLSKGGRATGEEWSCYTALTLFALHQQGNNDPMHTEKKVSLGRAMNEYVFLSGSESIRARMSKRLQALAVSQDMAEASRYLRDVIQLLKTKGIPIDYSMLAADLYRFQFEDGRTGVFLKWGQDFYCSSYAEADR